MAQLKMSRTASENEYLHRDFHGALSVGLEYLHKRYGEEAVRQYLWQFARKFYAPLTQDLNERGLSAIEEHLREIYALEGGAIRITSSADELRFEVETCPAVSHLRGKGYPVARLFRETMETVYRAICHETPFSTRLEHYDEQTGRSTLRFFRSDP